MKKYVYSFILSLFVAFAASARDRLPAPQMPAQSIYNGSDVMPLARLFAPFVKTVSHPIVVYNWSTANAAIEPWSKLRTARNGVGVQLAQMLSRTFWNNFGTTASENWYGQGFYMALDPVISRDFGGEAYSGSFFVLLQAQLPEGFRFLELKIAGYDWNPTASLRGDPSNEIVLDTSTQQLLESNACNFAIRYNTDGKSNTVSMSQIFRMAALANGSTCGMLVKKIFDEILQVDGFTYSWYGSEFVGSSCVSNSFSKAAMVIINPRFAKDSTVRIFTPNTRDAKDDRVRLQSLFYRAASVGQDQLGGYLPQILNQTSYQVRTIGFSAPVVRSRNDILLWPDLVGRPTTQNIDAWIAQNFLSCRGVY